ncbi:hypothetical protein Daura_39405 [Dactylosporangium aurantiacum]|uniref:Aminomethyltransferase C-terminal domain-containing protein n=1 Tax=Dactylosporangium aurantiacum TaxID=35754 RepID=A0A9Q9MKA5_9ACTN|nr:glycine cleavage T C-terminal barrel domain-containing protein [Dactylosporangium aurantiacum]MDG6101508.1 glycine cleavage T C-terminal barrel domain-containing protein [Dactylosporangium aurantiacum]UWZ52647.1 hypothetical protein Daura_39405 [Dactylosporangium aurantiacum]
MTPLSDVHREPGATFTDLAGRRMPPSPARCAAPPARSASPTGAAAGAVTSGAPSPALGHPAATASVPTCRSTPGPPLTVQARGTGTRRSPDATDVAPPFHSRQR